jgi:acyl-CoA synthetase (AMP-forming)/AMP-acid ligase II
MTPLANRVAESLRRHPERIAVGDATMILTYGELTDHTERAAATLTAFAGDPRDGRRHVGIMAANSVNYVICYLAVLRAGWVPFLIDAASGPAELASISRDCSLDLLIQDERPGKDSGAGIMVTRRCTLAGLFLSALRTRDQRHELLDDTEVCRFTSGSTGKPNCVEFSGAAVVGAATNWATGTGLTGEDRTACFAALSNGLAFNTSLLATFLAGASLHLRRGLPTGTRVVTLLRDVRATRLVGFPVLYESVLRRDLAANLGDTLRVAISSGAPLPAATRAEFRARAGVWIADYYGIAETGPLTFAAAPTRGLGTPLPGVRLRAGVPAEPTEIQVTSASMASRYLNAPGVLEARRTGDGYYRTGDEGYLDGGELFLTGRTARMINVNGRKVDPLEVAGVLREVAGVRDAVVFDTTDRHDHTVLAAVVAGDPALDADGLRRHCLRRLAGYKVPNRVHVLSAIPANSIGKPSLAALRALCTTGPGKERPS